MKIGIFGDSFASSHKSNSTDSWIDILANNFDVEVHSAGGSNLFFSISKFKEHYKKYDKNIFVVTSPGRIQLSSRVPVDNPNMRHVAAYNGIVWFIEEIKNGRRPKTMMKALCAARDYFHYLQDDSYDNYIHELMLENLRTMSKNTILIPAFKSSFHDGVNMCLYDIYLKENVKFGVTPFSNDFEDTRNCHMTAENNEILAKKVIHSLVSGNELNLSIEDFVTPENKDFYIKVYE